MELFTLDFHHSSSSDSHYAYYGYSVSHKNVSFVHLDAFSLAIFLSGMYQFHQTIPVSWCPNWILSMPCLSGFSFGNSFLIQPEEMSMICSDEILWLSILNHYSLSFIRVVHFILFSLDCRILKGGEDALFIFISPHVLPEHLTGSSSSRNICCIQLNWINILHRESKWIWDI